MKTKKVVKGFTRFHPAGETYMCGDEGSWIGQFVMSPHPEREEDNGGQAYDGNQRVKQSAEELGLLGKWVGGGCVERNREGCGKKKKNLI